MGEIDMDRVGGNDSIAYAELKAEPKFLLAVQSELQRIMNNKGLKYRDLARRLGVSEARVSQMFSDQARNLTIRTIAKVFFKLDEEPIVITSTELELLTSRAEDRRREELNTWSLCWSNGLDIVIAPHATIACELEKISASTLKPSPRDWAIAELTHAEKDVA